MRLALFGIPHALERRDGFDGNCIPRLRVVRRQVEAHVSYQVRRLEHCREMCY